MVPPLEPAQADALDRRSGKPVAAVRRDSDTHIPWDSPCIRTAPNHSGGDREYIGDAARDIDPAAPRIVPAAVRTAAAAVDRAAVDPGIGLAASARRP